MLLRIVNGTFIVLLGLLLWLVMGLRRVSPRLSAQLQRALVGLHVRLYRSSGGRLGGRIPASGPIVVLTTTGQYFRKQRAAASIDLSEGS